MMLTGWFLISLSAAWLGFAYVGYPAILLLLARCSPRPLRAEETSPSCSSEARWRPDGKRVRRKW